MEKGLWTEHKGPVFKSSTVPLYQLFKTR